MRYKYEFYLVKINFTLLNNVSEMFRFYFTKLNQLTFSDVKSSDVRFLQRFELFQLTLSKTTAWLFHNQQTITQSINQFCLGEISVYCLPYVDMRSKLNLFFKVFKNCA